MQLIVHVLGLELLHLEISTDMVAEDYDPALALSGGTTLASPVGFFAAHDIPDEIALPDRGDGWEDRVHGQG